MKPVFLSLLVKHPSGQKRVRQHSRKFTYEFRPPAEPGCRHEPIWSLALAANLPDDKESDDEERWSDDELDEEDEEVEE